MSFNVAPDTFTEEAFRGIISPYLTCMQGIGRMLAAVPDGGWDQSNCFDFEPTEVLLDACMEALQAYAKANHLFYNNDKLVDATTQAFVVAYGNSFIEAARSAS